MVTSGGTYTIKTWVVPAVVKTVGPIACGAHSCDTTDTLVLGKHEALSSYPNPFAVSTAVEFDLEESSSIQLTVMDIGGQIMRTLAEGLSPAGQHTIQWDGRDDQGVILPPGPYWIVLRIGGDYRYVLALIADTD